MNPISGLLVALGALTAVFFGGWVKVVRAVRGEGGAAALPAPVPATDVGAPSPLSIGVGAVTNFFDTLGIGSFATTTALFRFFKMVPDRIIPGTLNVGHTLPTVVQALVTVAIIPVDTLTLFSMIGASVLGAWLGAGIVAKWPKRNVQIGMGCALLVAAMLFFMTAMHLFPGGGDALGVRGVRLVVAIGGNFLLGALMSLGIGLYAPCMILISLLGMSPRSAYPRLIGSRAVLLP